MKYFIKYKLQSYDKQGKYRWVPVKDYVFDFSNTKMRIREAMLEVGTCIDVKDIVINGVPSRGIINTLMKMKGAKPTEMANLIIENIDKKQVLKRFNNGEAYT